MFKQIEELIIKNNLEAALAEISKILAIATSDQDSILNLIDVLEVDQMLQLIGKKILQEQKFDFGNKNINKNLNVYLSEEVYKNGGHTREIEDWINNTYSNKENILIITGFFYNSDKNVLKKLKEKNIKVLINYNASSKDRVGNIKWLQQQLYNLKPNAIFLSSTRSDIISIAALQPELSEKLFLNLSLDHGVSPGIHIKHLTKIIVKRPYLYFYLKDKFNFQHLVYVPLNRPDVIKLKEFRLKSLDEEIITASCTSAAQKIETNYIYKFVEVIPQVIKATGGKHIHVGAMSQEGLSRLYNIMDELGINRNRFIKIDHVASLARFLSENDVDILIQTFPIWGGLVTIEAMQAGVAIINHKHLYSYILNAVDSCYKEAFSWKRPEELYEFLQGLNREEISNQKKLSRDYYLKYHDPKLLSNFVDIENFVGIDVSDLENFIKKEFNYNVDLNVLLADKSTNVYKMVISSKRPILYRLKKSFKKRFYKFLANYFWKWI